MDGIHGVPDGYPLEIPCCYVQPRLEVEVNLLDWRCCEHHLKVVLVVYRRRRGVDLPVIEQTSVSHVSRVYRGVRSRHSLWDRVLGRTYHPNICVSLAIWRSVP